MDFDIEEILESAGFYALVAFGTVGLWMGYFVSKGIGHALPLWITLLSQVAVVVASAVFVSID